MDPFKKKDNTWEGPGCLAFLVVGVLVIVGLASLGASIVV